MTEENLIDETTPLTQNADNVSSRRNKQPKLSGYQLFFLEVALFSNAFLAGFDATVTAATYTTISNALHAAKMASWVTTSYLLTYTAFLSLYGSFSDILGRRICFSFSTVVFGLGCLGCGLSPDIISLIVFRALTGVGGAGLITMATIINSDVISSDKRAMYQAFQNMLLGLGNICGASIGGWIADTFGWRWCFLSQVPLCIFALTVGHHFIKNNFSGGDDDDKEHNVSSGRQIINSIDIRGSVILVLGLMIQLVALSVGGNKWEWSDYRIIGLFILSGVFLALFAIVEARTTASPIVPLSMLTSLQSVSQLIIHLTIGMASFAYLFILPLIFQVILGDTPSKSGLRLMVPSLSTPIGAVLTGTISSKHPNALKYLVILGTMLMLTGSILALFVSKSLNHILFTLFLVPTNLGLGMALPASLFTFVYSFEKKKQAISTSIVYLTRGMGSVWGVAISSTIIQSQVRNGILQHISPRSTAKYIIDQLKESISIIGKLKWQNQQIVISEYDRALKWALVFTISCCFIASIISFTIPAKPKHRHA